MIAADQVTATLAERLRTGAGRWEQRVLAEAPGARRVAACAFHPASGAPPVRTIAKCYEDATGERTARVMAAVRGQLRTLAEPTVLAVPRPLFYDRDGRLLVQQVAPGRPYPELLAQRDPTPCLRAAGQAIATLHGLPIPLGRPRMLADHLTDLVRPHPMELAERLPHVATRVNDLLDALAAGERAFGAPVAAPTHRDLHLKQLLHDGTRVWLLDWDLAQAADPALDLGNLIASIATKLPGDRARACADALLEGYAPGDRSGAIARYPLYAAFTYLRLASKRFRLEAPGWRGVVDDLLARAEGALQR